jgi:hypothetical protein
MSYRVLQVLIFCFFIGFFYSCSDDNELDYINGELLIQTHDTTSFKSISDLVYNLQLSVKELQVFEYFEIDSLITKDSIRSVLQSKPYLTNGGKTFSIHNFNDSLFCDISFFDLDSAEVSDWFSTTISLGLSENTNSAQMKWGILKVPIGMEHFWLLELKKYPIIKHVQLNHIGRS